MSSPKTCALLISTYNWTDALRFVLESVLRQTRLPDEILIADDGSGPETRELIDAFRAKMPCPIRHVWQEDLGFRLAAARNSAIAQCRSEYLIQIDGDCVLEPHFIEDYLANARPGWFSCGSRVLFTRERTKEMFAAGNFTRFGVFSSGVQNRVNVLRISWLSRFLRERYRARKRHVARGCNMAFWMRDLIAVNGYNEDISGWGTEDRELEIRLKKFGVRRQLLKFCAVLVHLFHEKRSCESSTRSREILEQALASEQFRTPHGIVRE